MCGAQGTLLSGPSSPAAHPEGRAPEAARTPMHRTPRFSSSTHAMCRTSTRRPLWRALHDRRPHRSPPSSSLLCVAVPLPTPRPPYKSSRQDPARARISSHPFRQLTRAPPHVISTPLPSCRIRSRPGPSYHPRVSPRTP
jgi:hypothetical protein